MTTAPAFPPPPDGDPRVAVLLSGGVDSAVAAALLREAGYRVEGVTLRLHEAAAADGDAADAARAVAARLDVPWRMFDLRAVFRERVLEPFVAAYLGGRTPSPCVGCNPSLKLGLAAELIRRHTGIRRLATGHYARVERDAAGRPHLCRAADPRRDQSYFLYRLPEALLDRLALPLGAARDKAALRAWARARGLEPADRGDSMDLCFLPGGDYRALLPRADGAAKPPALCPGPIVDAEGRVVGEHAGCARYTVGQRKGLGAHAGPRYVVALRPADNTIVIGPRAQAMRRTVRAVDPVYGPDGPPPAGSRWGGRVRSGGEPRPCRVEAADARSLAVRFDEPRFAPAPGQHLVLYDDRGRVAGGGEIDHTAP